MYDFSALKIRRLPLSVLVLELEKLESSFLSKRGCFRGLAEQFLEHVIADC